MAELILALDLPDETQALRLVDRLPRLRWVKVGSILMTRAGPKFVRTLLARGLSIFLDLKWHDIPNTVRGSVEAAKDLGVAMATVHTIGGEAMMVAAAEAAGSELALVGVTVLTSHDWRSYSRATGRGQVEILDEVPRLAGLAAGAGLAGVVCSPLEVRLVKSAVGPDGLIVVPGIRRDGDQVGDQVRSSSPGATVRAGATHLVVGRPILEAADPASAWEGFLGELGR